MKALSAVIGFLFLICGVAISQEQKSKPQIIFTKPTDITGKLKSRDKKLIDARLEAVFTPTDANTDDTFYGTLLFKISDRERLQIGKALGKSASEIPSEVQKKNIVAAFVRDTKCPDLEIEFLPMDVEIANAVTHLERFKLSFQESEQELSQAICLWIKRIQSGRGGTRGAMVRINKLLKGEGPDR